MSTTPRPRVLPPPLPEPQRNLGEELRSTLVIMQIVVWLLCVLASAMVFGSTLPPFKALGGIILSFVVAFSLSKVLDGIWEYVRHS